MKKPKELEEYFREAVSWDAERSGRARRSARVAWIAAGLFAVCAVASSTALSLLTPLKRVDPFVIRVDNTTGVIDVVPVFDGIVTQEEALTRYFLNHYISICERFNYTTAESDYQECGAFNSNGMNALLSKRWNKSNPESPLNQYRDGTTVTAQVTSISFFERSNGVTDLVQVRYVKSKRMPSLSEEVKTHWIATVQYAYAKPSQDARVRRWNPLGFKIAEFKSEPEILDPPANKKQEKQAQSQIAQPQTAQGTTS